MMRVWVFPLIFLALTACSTKTIEVRIPIPVPCITETIPEPIYPIVKEDAGIFERVKALLAERELRIGYETKLQAALSACAEI